jgi:hypothetical protein
MFCWPCIIVYQYTETNVMHFLFSLLRIKSLYMFRALLVRTQEALNKRQLVYCVLRARYVNWLYQVQPIDITCMHCTKCRLCVTSWGWASNARNIWRPWFLINWKKNVSRWLYSAGLLQCTVNKTSSLESRLLPFGLYLSFIFGIYIMVYFMTTLQVYKVVDFTSSRFIAY